MRFAFKNSMSVDFEFEQVLRCYFFGQSFSEDKMTRSSGLAGFAIPDLGIVFRSRFKGSLFECQYTGLLALLRFIDTNIKNFKGVSFEILSDSAVVVYQITNRKFVSEELIPVYRTVIGYHKKFPFKVSWVPADENLAISGLVETPSLSPGAEFNLDIEIKSNYKELGKGYKLL
jgi:hypothetical protein